MAALKIRPVCCDYGALEDASLRDALLEEAGAIQAIYAPYVTSTIISFEDVPPSPADMASRIRNTLDGGYPYLVAERDGTVLGYAYAGMHNARAAYRGTVETTVYVSKDHHAQGIGRALYEALLTQLKSDGYRSALGIISLPNPGSVGIHEVFGFKPSGIIREAGFKFGQWHDVGWWQKMLRD
jgi:L-amino acid N-acyltransferase YncA